MQTVLLVEDSPEFQIIVKNSLEIFGMNLVVASTLKEARRFLTENSVDLILLDIHLPDGDGLEFCSQLKADQRSHQIPIIFLTSKNEATDQVAGFALGAEDYISKPFHLLEFKARVESRLKKLRTSQEDAGAIRKSGLYISPMLQRAFDVSEGKERELGLTTLEFKLLFHLARNENCVFTRDQLLTSIWGHEVHVFDRTVDTHICSLRKKLAPISHLVESVTGVGYRFTNTPKSKQAA